MVCIEHERAVILPGDHFMTPSHFMTMSGREEVQVASCGHNSEMLLNILQCPGQPPRTKNYRVQNINIATVKKPVIGNR